MIKLLATSALVLAVATSASAGGVSPPASSVPIAPPVASAQIDWSGFYAGANVGVAFGNIENSLAAADDLSNDAIFGAFIGYNQQRGNIVFGGELDYTISPIGFEMFTTTSLDNNIDIKARVGYAVGDILIYGVGGYSFVTLNGFEPAPLSGFNFGAGIDYKIGDRFFVGAEYLVRSLSGEFPSDPLNFFTNQLASTAKIRAGMTF